MNIEDLYVIVYDYGFGTEELVSNKVYFDYKEAKKEAGKNMVVLGIDEWGEDMYNNGYMNAYG